ncbi:hypothetical protein [Streptomyces sp. YIM 98790]|uniref:hypothetical protein n=1 Tax=Streptomyces sp. YIM 98790 TaxID=2689077 RepID=UPI00140B6ED9|nr:hypothetical protein [Streptomyces sp. YIM 98790]
MIALTLLVIPASLSGREYGPPDPGVIPASATAENRVIPDMGAKSETPTAEEILSDPRLLGQAAAQQVADTVRTTVEEKNLTGFVDAKVAADSVEILWHGKVPGAIRRIVERTDDVTVTLTPSAYSLAEIDAAVEALLGELAEHSSDGVVMVGPTNDYAALQVTLAEQATRTFRALPKESLGIPVVYTDGPTAVPAVRWDDTSPFWGGSVITNSFSDCSTAFAVRHANQQKGLLTAEHCHNPSAGNTWVVALGGRPVGDRYAWNRARDAMTLSGADYANRIYIGPWNSGVNQSRPVHGAINPSVGTFVFHSGGYSGAHVLLVEAVRQYVMIPDRNGELYTVGPGFVTRDADGLASVGQGDSGGPVAGVYNDDPTKVTARGLISAIFLGDDVEGPCQGVPIVRRCSSLSFHIGIDNIETAMNLTVLTS